MTTKKIKELIQFYSKEIEEKEKYNENKNYYVQLELKKFWSAWDVEFNKKIIESDKKRIEQLKKDLEHNKVKYLIADQNLKNEDVTIWKLFIRPITDQELKESIKKGFSYLNHEVIDHEKIELNKALELEYNYFTKSESGKISIFIE